MTNLQRIIIILAAFGTVSIVLSQTNMYETRSSVNSVPAANIHINSHDRDIALIKASKTKSNDDHAQQELPRTIVTNIYQSGTGSFYFHKQTGPGNLNNDSAYTSEYEASSLLSTHADIKITGPIARTRLTQVFSNSSEQIQSGVFVFPLPQDAAVDHLLMRVGERNIEGVIKPKGIAKEMFSQAKAQGKRVSLVEQLRPNMFTNHIANIPANTSISVTIEYQQFIRQNQHQYSLRLPLSITPRYQENTDTSLPEHTLNNQVNTLTPNTSIKVSLNAGIPISHITSEHHPIKTTNPYATEYHVVLDTQQAVNKDFVLNWQMKAAHNIQASHFNYQSNDYEYGLITLMPPKMDKSIQKRNLVFILDVSGSMVGEALMQAKQAIAFAIEDLKEDDYFNLVTFSSDAHKLWYQSEMASQAFKDEALGYLYDLEANGGTQIQKALDMAFALPTINKTNHDYLNQILFVTDGSVGNENQLMQSIYQNLGDYRLFTVGIGSAPNAYFMNEAATAGKGTFTYIGDISLVQKKMQALLSKLKHPALTNIALNIKDAKQAFGFEIYPSILPDLYADESLTLTYRRKLSADNSNVPHINANSIFVPFSIEGEYLATTAQAKTAKRKWTSQLPTVSAQTERGIHKYWARMKIRDLNQQLNMRKPYSEGYETIQTNMQAAITKVALNHHLVSEYTSLIAIDHDLAQSADENAAKLEQSKRSRQMLAQTRLPSTATPAGLFAVIGGLLLLFASLLINNLSTAD